MPDQSEPSNKRARTESTDPDPNVRTVVLGLAEKEEVEADEKKVAAEEADETDIGTTPATCAELGPDILVARGVLVITEALADGVLAAVQEKSRTNVEEVLRLFMLRQALGGIRTRQFLEVNCRDGNRFDIRHHTDKEPLCSLAKDGVWMSVVHAVLGSDAVLLFCGVVLARGSGIEGSDQAWHQDGGHLFEVGEHLPCHCLNVFVPLVDISEENGPTQFILGSHLKSFGIEDDEEESEAMSVTCKAGTAVVFDYRVLHRGAANVTDEDRPCLYFTYAKPWFRDHKNLRATESLLDSADSTQQS